MPNKIFLLLLLGSPLVLSCVQNPDCICEEIVAWDSENERLYNDKLGAYWGAWLDNEVLETNETEALSEELEDVYTEYEAQAKNKSDCFLQYRELIEKCNNDTLFVVLDYFKTKTAKSLSGNESSELNASEKKMNDYFAKNNTIDGVSYAKEPDLLEYMKQRDYDVLWRGWEQYHDDATAELKDDFVRIVELTKKDAQNNGYKDLADKWVMDEFNDTSMEKYMDHLLKDTFPLYIKLHAYIRSKLFDFYKDKAPEDHKHVFSDAKNTIPVHILGDMWAQQAKNIGDLLVPYPDANPIDLTKILKDKGYNIKKLFELSESFFTSLGLDPMTDTFWEKSHLDNAGSLGCKATAYDVLVKDDYRIVMCTQIDDINFFVVHHEMGHIVNFMLYKDQPYIWKGLASIAFSEAIGDTIVLSARSRKHLKAIGFLEGSAENEELAHKERINDLLETSLMQVFFLPFIYLVDKWRFGVFRGEITPDEYNKKWWELRKKYNGLSSPVARPDDGFDAGSKFHIPIFYPFIRYFYSFMGQFQFHEALCKAAGQTEDFSNCDIYNSKEAGKKLRDFLSPGSSRPWRELLKEFAGEDNFQSRALVSYFKPLDEWLTVYLKENNIPVGWDGMWDMKLDGQA